MRTQMEKKLDQKRIEEATIRYAELQRKKKEIDAKFNKAKSTYYSLMNEAFEKGLIGDDVQSVEFLRTFDFGSDNEHTVGYKSTRIQPVSVTFDPIKLREALTECDVDPSSVVRPNVTVLDYKKLAAYVKSLGGKPSEFKDLLDVSYTVDQKELDKMVDIGMIDQEDLVGTYETKLGNVSFRVTVKDDSDGEDY